MEAIYLKAKIMNDLHKHSKPCLMDELKITAMLKHTWIYWVFEKNYSLRPLTSKLYKNDFTLLNFYFKSPLFLGAL